MKSEFLKLVDKICWKLRIGKPYRVSFPSYWCDHEVPHSMDLLNWLEDNVTHGEWKIKRDFLWRRYHFKDKNKAIMFKIVWG